MSLNKYNVLISYDVNGKQDEVKEELKKLNYMDRFRIDNQATLYYLPETTLWKSDTDTPTAKAEMVKVCDQLKVNLERFVATEFSKVSAIQGKSYKS